MTMVGDCLLVQQRDNAVGAGARQRRPRSVRASMLQRLRSWVIGKVVIARMLGPPGSDETAHAVMGAS